MIVSRLTRPIASCPTRVPWLIARGRVDLPNAAHERAAPPIMEAVEDPSSLKPTASETADRRTAPPKPGLAIISGPDIASRLPLAKLLARDFEVTLIGSHNFASSTLGGLQYRFFRLDRSLNPPLDLVALVQLRRLLSDLKPRVVQTFSTKPSVLGRLAAARAKVPVIVGTVPGMGSIYGDDRVVTRLIRGVYELAQREACRVSNLTVFQNDDDLTQFVGRRLVRREAATVVRGSGVDTEAFRPDAMTVEERRQLRSSLGISERAVVVTMVTRVIRSKGVLDFAEAATLVRAGPLPLEFLLVGELDTESRDALSRGEWTSVQRHVRCLGTRTDVPAILGITDVFALPSYYREGLPRALLEAAASGIALIGTDLPGCRDVVIDGVTGLMVSPRDPCNLAEAIRRLAADRAMRERMGAAARLLAVENYDVRNVARAMSELYVRLLDQQAGHPPR